MSITIRTADNVIKGLEELLFDKGTERNDLCEYAQGYAEDGDRVPICVVGHYLDQVGLLGLVENDDEGIDNLTTKLEEHFTDDALTLLFWVQKFADGYGIHENGEVREYNYRAATTDPAYKVQEHPTWAQAVRWALDNHYDEGKGY